MHPCHSFNRLSSAPGSCVASRMLCHRTSADLELASSSGASSKVTAAYRTIKVTSSFYFPGNKIE